MHLALPVAARTGRADLSEGRLAPDTRFRSFSLAEVVEQARAESEQAVRQQFLRAQARGQRLLQRAVTADEAQELCFRLEPVELSDVAVARFGHKLDEVYARTLYSSESVAASAAMRRQHIHALRVEARRCGGGWLGCGSCGGRCGRGAGGWSSRRNRGAGRFNRGSG